VFLLPQRSSAQTKTYHPNTVSPTHRKVRSAIPTRFILRLPSSCSRALSVAKRMRSKRPGAATTEKALFARLSLRERKPTLGCQPKQNPGRGPGGAKNVHYTLRKSVGLSGGCVEQVIHRKHSVASPTGYAVHDPPKQNHKFPPHKVTLSCISPPFVL